LQWVYYFCIINIQETLTMMQITIVDIANPKNYDNKDWPEGLIFFSDEWNFRKSQCQNFINSHNKVHDRKIHGRKCVVKEILPEIGKQFIATHHIQGSNHLGVVFFGLFYSDELIGVMSLGRHSRQISNNRIVLDRFCIANGVHVQGGATKLFSRCIEWAKSRKYDEIISFSDNRITDGQVYKIMGFFLEKNHKSDYCYVDSNNPHHRLSKQSQKKSSSKCPEGMTEFDWANVRGLKKLWDKGKKRWVYHLNQNAKTWIQKLSANCAEQNRLGVFKHSHIRGYFTSEKCQSEIYYSSSYELRCLYLLENDLNVASFRRAETFIDSNNKSRNPDIYVVYTDGTVEILEVKPDKRFQKEADVKKQIDETAKFAASKGIKFSVWSERNSGLKNDHAIIQWAKKFIAETTGNIYWLEKQKQNNKKKAKKHYDNVVAKNTVTVWCDFCKQNHQPLRLTYDKNIDRNGRYICEREGGHISGSKPKLHLIKENPYANENKKQCSACKEIKSFDEFGTDKSRRDGYATRCKVCRAKGSNQRYHQS
jgi:hypothetical protein